MARGKIHPVRFGDAEWELIAAEAQRNGTSAAQFIRDAALTRAVWRIAQRADPGDMTDDMVAMAQKLAEARWPVEGYGKESDSGVAIGRPGRGIKADP